MRVEDTGAIDLEMGCTHGEDSFGEIAVPRKHFPCDACGLTVIGVFRWLRWGWRGVPGNTYNCGDHTRKLGLPEDVDVEDTIAAVHPASESTITSGVNATVSVAQASFLGITCGCYAKWHRQVTHIADGVKRRRNRRTK